MLALACKKISANVVGLKKFLFSYKTRFSSWRSSGSACCCQNEARRRQPRSSTSSAARGLQSLQRTAQTNASSGPTAARSGHCDYAYWTTDKSITCIDVGWKASKEKQVRHVLLQAHRAMSKCCYAVAIRDFVVRPSVCLFSYVWTVYCSNRSRRRCSVSARRQQPDVAQTCRWTCTKKFCDWMLWRWEVSTWAPPVLPPKTLKPMVSDAFFFFCFILPFWETFVRVAGWQLSKSLVLDMVSLCMCHGVRHIWCM